MKTYDATEQDLVVKVFADMLWSVTRDGGKKRAAGEKPPWWRDDSHEAAIFSHISKWKHGEKVDKDSGAHPFVHLAWRALAIAYQETAGKVDPAKHSGCPHCGSPFVQVHPFDTSRMWCGSCETSSGR